VAHFLLDVKIGSLVYIGKYDFLFVVLLLTLMNFIVIVIRQSKGSVIESVC
jgi:hypothetical protein